jgi:sigma-70-like protein
MPSTSLNSPWSRPAPRGSGPADRVPEFEVLYRANVAAVTAYFARRSADPQTVAGLTADTFVQAIMSFATFDPRKGTPRAWVFGIARRICAARLLLIAVAVTVVSFVVLPIALLGPHPAALIAKRAAQRGARLRPVEAGLEEPEVARLVRHDEPFR